MKDDMKNLFYSLLFLPVLLQAQVTNWPYESLEKMDSSINYLYTQWRDGDEECKDLFYWQSFKRELRLDSFQVVRSYGWTQDSLVTHDVFYDTTFLKKGISITRIDSFHTNYYLRQVPDSVEWMVILPNALDFIEWKLYRKLFWIY